MVCARMQASYLRMPIRKQLLSTFVMLVIISLAVICGICLGYLFAVRSILVDQSEGALVTQMQNNMKATSSESADIVRSVFQRGTTGFLNFYALAAEDALRGPYQLNKFHYYDLSPRTRTYQEYGTNSLPTPLTQVTRYGTEQIGLSASTWFLPHQNQPRPGFPSLTVTQQLRINYTQHTDPYFVHAFKKYDDFVAGYIGFSDKIFRTYPAVETASGNRDPQRTYDCTSRGWYTGATASGTARGTVFYSSPYPDFNDKGWMVTFSRPVYGRLVCSTTTTCDYNGTTLVGVAGADMLLQDLYNQLAPIKIGESGKVILIETGGQVVADKDFDLEGDTEMYFDDLVSPAVSQALMDEMSAAPFNVSVVREVEDTDGTRYLLNYYRLSDFGGKYIIITTALESEVTAPISALTDETNKKAIEVSSVLIIVGAGLTIALAVIIVYLTHQIVEPIEHLTRTSQKIAANIGRGDIFYGIEQYEGRSALGEIQRLNSHANAMINTLRVEQKEAKTSTMQRNQYYHNDNNVWDQGQAALTAPPPPFDEDNSFQGGGYNSGESKHAALNDIVAPPINFNTPAAPNRNSLAPINSGPQVSAPPINGPDSIEPPPFNPNLGM